MFQTVSQHDFVEAFRTTRPDNFSYDGLKVLFDYLEKLEDSCGEPIEFDAIAICCTYTESTLSEVNEAYELIDEAYELIDDDDDDDKNASILEALCDNTEVIEIPDTDRVIYLAW